MKIIMPLVKPALSTLTIMTFQSAWGATEASTNFINNESLKTFAFYLSTLSASGTVSGQGVAAAATLIMFVPNLIIFIFMQSKVMSTMAHSGIK
jgi:multiple sugar transport system permease protein